MSQAQPCPECGGSDRFYLVSQPRNGGEPFWHCRQCGHSASANGSEVETAQYIPQSYSGEQLALIQLAYAAVADYCMGLLWQPIGRMALDYLRRQRGLTDEAIRAMRLGYHPADWDSNGYDSTKNARDSQRVYYSAGHHLYHLNEALYKGAQLGGLIGPRGQPNPVLKDTITIPYLDRGEVVMIRGRRIGGGDGPKYLSPSGIKMFAGGTPSLYASAVIQCADSLILTEGEFKAGVANQAYAMRQVSIPTVAQPGIGYLPAAYIEALKGKTVYLGYDNDIRKSAKEESASEKYTRLNGRRLRAAGLAVRVLEFPRNGHKVDLDSFVLESGAAALQFLIDNAPEHEAWEERQARAIGPDYLGEFEATDAGNAEALKWWLGDTFQYCGAIGWLTYSGSHWAQESAEAALGLATVSTLRLRRAAGAKAGKEAVVQCSQPNAARVEKAKKMFRDHAEVSVSTFDNNPDLLNVGNGVLNLRTGDLSPHSPEQRFTYCLDTNYYHDADYADWVKWLTTVVRGGTEIVDYLQMAVGCSITGDVSQEILWYISGPPRSGKGTFTETLLALLGSPLSAEVDFSTFTMARDTDANNFDLAGLKAARMIIASESNQHQRVNAARIKQFTGGNEVRCCHKHRSHFTYKPQFKIWLVSNHQFNGDPDDDALWTRPHIIEFPNSYVGKENRALKAQMRSPRNLEAVLAWAVQGAIKWYALGATGLIAPVLIQDTVQAVRNSVDYIQQWIDECTETGEGLWATSEKIYMSYENWCKRVGVVPKLQTALGIALKKKGFTPYRNRAERGWQGIAVNVSHSEKSVGPAQEPQDDGKNVSQEKGKSKESWEVDIANIPF